MLNREVSERQTFKVLDQISRNEPNLRKEKTAAMRKLRGFME